VGKQFSLGSARTRYEGAEGFGDWGWEFSAVNVLQSGYPFSVYALGDTANNGDGGERANLVGNPRLSSGQSIEHWFNTAAFSNPLTTPSGIQAQYPENSEARELRSSRHEELNITESQKLQLRGSSSMPSTMFILGLLDHGRPREFWRDKQSS